MERSPPSSSGLALREPQGHRRQRKAVAASQHQVLLTGRALGVSLPAVTSSDQRSTTAPRRSALTWPLGARAGIDLRPESAFQARDLGATSGPHPTRQQRTTPGNGGHLTSQLDSPSRPASQVVRLPRFSLARKNPSRRPHGGNDRNRPQPSHQAEPNAYLRSLAMTGRPGATQIFAPPRSSLLQLLGEARPGGRGRATGLPGPGRGLGTAEVGGCSAGSWGWQVGGRGGDRVAYGGQVVEQGVEGLVVERAHDGGDHLLDLG